MSTFINFSRTTLPNTSTNHLLESLITLTKERDVYELERSLKQSLSKLISHVSGTPDVKVEIYRLREISQMFLSTISGEQRADSQTVAPALCQLLLDCYNTGHYYVYDEGNEINVHVFPLKNEVAYNNAVIAVEANHLDVNLIESISCLLGVYQNYLALLSDNERDTLTGLLNRKTFDLRINKVLSQLAQKQLLNDGKTEKFYYLAIFDIDHFKRVNDGYGHLIGDEVLLLFSQLMANTFRETDPMFRFGGEEFIGIFACANHSDIGLVLTRFSQQLAKYSFPQVGKITVSIGCVEITPEHSPSQLVDHADLALYYAKNNGRNQICYYEQLIAQGLLQEQHKEGEIEMF